MNQNFCETDCVNILAHATWCAALCGFVCIQSSRVYFWVCDNDRLWYTVQYRKGEWRKKVGERREVGQTREKMNLFPPPPQFSSDELAWWHVVWKAMSSAICVSLLPLVRVTLWLPGSKSFFFSVVSFIRSFCIHTFSSSCLLAKQIHGL